MDITPTINPAREIGVACGTILALLGALSIAMDTGPGVVIGCMLADAMVMWSLFTNEQPSFTGIPEYDDV